MKSDFLLAFNEIAEVRKLPRETILDALQAALVSAYRRNAGVGSGQHVEARIDDKLGTITLWVEKEVVEDILNELTEVTLENAKVVNPDARLGDMVVVESTPEDFGRIAAQTAKQVILQRMREAEREAQFQEYFERVGDLVTGTVQSDSGGVVTLGLGRTEAIMPRSQQMPGEKYRVHDKVRAYVMDVHRSNRGPQIVVSRTHRNMLRRLLEYEVPEIYNGTVEIKSIAREPGARSKVAVAALQEGADPVGACVGMRGVRIQSIVRELNNEKIDVIEWNPDSKQFIAKALSPARVSSVFLDDDPDAGRTAMVVVPEDQLSLAIGREGQNARLGAKLTGWRIDIKSIIEASQEAIQHLQDPLLVDLSSANAELTQNVKSILEKKETNRAILPEEYHTLIEFINLVENGRLDVKEVSRTDQRARREAARAGVPQAAYMYSLEDTDLPTRIANSLAEAGFSTVGQVMEQHLIEPRVFVNIQGLGAPALDAIEKMLQSVDFSEPAVSDSITIEQASEASSEEAQVDSGVETLAVDGVPVDDGLEGELARAQRAALVAQLTGEPSVPQGVAITTESGAQTADDEVPDDFGEEENPFEFEGMTTAEAEEARREKARQRRRQLVFDESAGRVVAKRRHKASRTKGKWDELSSEDVEE